VEPDITAGGGTRVRNSWGRGRRRLRIAGAVGGSLAVAAALLAVTAPVQAINTAKTGALDLRGFPTSYTDDGGLSTMICEDGTANCGGATTADLADTTDGEAFYWSADANLSTTRGDLQVIMAQEAAYASANVPLVFDRLRVRGHLTRVGDYTLLTPYGRLGFRVDNTTDQRNVFVTDDLPCPLTPGAAPCADNGHITNFLRSTSAPAGYLGNAAAATPVTGGTARNEVVLLGANGEVLGRTNRFIVMGKLAPGPQALMSADVVDFGNTKRVARRSVVVRNLGDAPLNLRSVRLLGANRITKAPGGCAAGGTVAARSSCRVNLTYRPGARKSMTGTLVINDNSAAATHRVPVRASTTGVASSPRRVRFRATNVGRTSRTRRVVVTNTGVVPMRIKGVSLSGGQARSFQRRSGQGPLCAKGARVRVGKACAIYVRFAPQNFGAKTTDLVVRTNNATRVHRIALNGRGR
jgi:hypothetical protein